MTDNWQEISTAPKDGTEIFVYEPSLGSLDNWTYSRAWYEVETDSWETPYGRMNEPTHWMPLPNPPEDT